MMGIWGPKTGFLSEMAVWLGEVLRRAWGVLGEGDVRVFGCLGVRPSALGEGRDRRCVKVWR